MKTSRVSSKPLIKLHITFPTFTYSLSRRLRPEPIFLPFQTRVVDFNSRWNSNYAKKNRKTWIRSGSRLYHRVSFFCSVKWCQFAIIDRVHRSRTFTIHLRWRTQMRDLFKFICHRPRLVEIFRNYNKPRQGFRLSKWPSFYFCFTE